MGEHAQLSPSAAHRWLACPASVRESATLVSADNAASRAGTAAHEVLNIWLTTGAPPEVGFVTSNGLPVTREMIDIAREVVDYIKGYIGIHSTNHVVVSEEKVEIGTAFGLEPGICFGTLDVQVMSKEELLILDLKAGYQTVVAEENPQLILYAIGSMEEMGWLYDSIRLVIIQPKDGAPKEWVITKQFLLDKLAAMAPAVKAALQSEEIYNPTEEGCRYCPAAGVCRALQQHSIELAKKEFAAVDAVTRLDVTELGMLLDKASLIETAIVAAREHAMKLISLGTEVPGWKLVESRKNRVWKNEDKAIAAFRLLGYNEAEFAPPKMLSPAQAEKLLKDKKFMADLVETPAGSPTLAPVTDKRPALAAVMGVIGTGNLLD